MRAAGRALGPDNGPSQPVIERPAPLPGCRPQPSIPAACVLVSVCFQDVPGGLPSLIYGRSSSRFLTYCPSKRILSDEGLKHEYFRETPLPIDPSMFPTWPAKSEQQRVKRGTSPRPPEGGLGYSHLVRTSGWAVSMTSSERAPRTQPCVK